MRRQRRRAEDQRYRQRGVVGEQAVRGFAVLAERLAVIGGDNHQGVIERVRDPKAFDQPAQHGVGIGDLAVVRCTAGAVLGRRIVRRVRIEQMHPGEPRATHSDAGRRLKDPVAGTRHHLAGTPLGELKRRSFDARQTVVVLVEAVAEAEAAVQHERADKRTGAVAGRLCDGGERRDPARA